MEEGVNQFLGDHANELQWSVTKAMAGKRCPQLIFEKDKYSELEAETLEMIDFVEKYEEKRSPSKRGQ